MLIISGYRMIYSPWTSLVAIEWFKYIHYITKYVYLLVFYIFICEDYSILNYSLQLLITTKYKYYIYFFF